jgi:hypothetical protein
MRTRERSSDLYKLPERNVSNLLASIHQISGFGLALAGVSIEQDAAYWEAQIDIPADGGAMEVMFGVATKKDRKFYNALDEQEEGT